MKLKGLFTAVCGALGLTVATATVSVGQEARPLPPACRGDSANTWPKLYQDTTFKKSFVAAPRQMDTLYNWRLEGGDVISGLTTAEINIPGARNDTTRLYARVPLCMAFSSIPFPGRVAQSGGEVALMLEVSAESDSAVTVHGRPFVKHPVKSGDELAKLLLAGQDGDMSVLNIGADRFVGAMNETFSYLHLENRIDLAAHLRSLKVVPCPTGSPMKLARMVGSKVDVDGWEREARKGELCGFNSTKNRYELSFYCGNITPNLFGSTPKVATVNKPLVEVPRVVDTLRLPGQTDTLRLTQTDTVRVPMPVPPPPAPASLVQQENHGQRNCWFRVFGCGGLAVVVAGGVSYAIVEAAKHSGSTSSSSTCVSIGGPPCPVALSMSKGKRWDFSFLHHQF
jgi:hypothetical protein